MPIKPVKHLKPHHIEVARLIALETPTGEIARLTHIAQPTISVWRRDPKIMESVKGFRAIRDAGHLPAFRAKAYASNATARQLLKDAEVEAVNKIVTQMREGHLLSQQYAAALEVLKLLGYYAIEKGGQIVINISGGDLKDMRLGMEQVKLPEPIEAKALADTGSS